MDDVRILLDCDTGIDDTIALLYLAAMAHADRAELVAVGTVHGNVPARVGALNTLSVLELAGLPGVPVAVGAERPMAQEASFAYDWHGADGLGNIPRLPRSGEPVAESAPEQLIGLARRSPGELTVLAVGPLTNLAIALMLEPALPELVSDVVIMGGALDHPGNVTSHAEANIWHDPEAAELVLAAHWPVTLVPLDVTHPTALGTEWLERLAALDSPAARLADAVLAFYTEVYSPVLESPGCVVHDALAAMLAVDPGLAEYQARPVRVELRGEQTRGATLWDRRSVVEADGDVWTGRPAVRVATSADATAFHERLLASLA
jgi:purine nucleosidase